MPIWKKTVNLDALKERLTGTIGQSLGIEINEVGDDYLKGRMPVDERTRQPLGILHGGASCVLAESVGSTASYFSLDDEHYCVGLEINANHIRSVREGWVIATATPFHLGGSTQVWNIPIHDEQGRLVCITRLTMAIMKFK